MTNIILNTDGYKHSHSFMLDSDIEYSTSYIEARIEDKQTVSAGIAYLKKTNNFRITQEDIDEAEDILTNSGVDWNKEGWEYILKEHDGILPVHIEAVKEGTVLKSKNVLLQITNKDPKLAWLPSFLETMLLRSLWYAITVASLSHSIRQSMTEMLNLSCDNPQSCLSFMLNDFGSRGVSSYESSVIGGLSHLICFNGSDNLPAVSHIRKLYGDKIEQFTVNASEHSVTTSWLPENEMKAVKTWLESFPDKPLSVVIDSYNDLEFIQSICNQFEDIVKKRSIPLILRPDSRKPVDIICGDQFGIIHTLWDKYGGTINSKGYKVLAPYVRIIQGDGVNEHSIREIQEQLIAKGYSVENVVFGMGGKLLQGVDRDTLKFAMKCCEVIMRDGTIRKVSKNPIGDPGKKSKEGRLALIKEDAEYKTIKAIELGDRKNYLYTIFNGSEEVPDDHMPFAEVRSNYISHL